MLRGIKRKFEAAQANLARDETMIGQAYANLRRDRAQSQVY
jgi:hypothetical protein